MEVNQKQLAALLGISSRQVRNLKEQGLFEFVTDSRKYNAEKCVQEYIDFKIKAGSRQRDKSAKRKRAGRTRKI